IAPVRKLPTQHAPSIALIPQQGLLPQRVIGVLHLKRRKIRRSSAHTRPIAKRKVPRQRTQRPAVPSNVMQNQKQDVLAPAKRKQMRTQRHLAREIKPSLRRLRQRPRKLNFAHPANPNPHPPPPPPKHLLPPYPKPPPAALPNPAQERSARAPRGPQNPPQARLPAPPPPAPHKAKPPAGSCSARRRLPAAPKTTADAAQKTTAPQTDARAHAT